MTFTTAPRRLVDAVTGATGVIGTGQRVPASSTRWTDHHGHNRCTTTGAPQSSCHGQRRQSPVLMSALLLRRLDGHHVGCSVDAFPHRRRVTSPLMVAETSHKDGERGALRAKQWLESTTHVAIPFTVYDDARQTTVVGLDQKLKRYDLAGHFLGENRRPLFVEVKSYNATGSQGPDYMEFLANAYSATALQKKQGNDQGREFMWLTTHPFSLNKWVKLSSPDEIRDALKEHDSVLAGEEIDEGLLTEVSKRLWLVLLHERQYELVLSREELYKVYGALGRKGF